MIGLNLGLGLSSRIGGSGSAAPANAIRQRDGSYILDRAGNYIEVRA